MNYTARSLRLRIPRICVSITADDAAEMMDKAESVLRENSLIELRLDHLKAPLGAMSRLRRLTEARPDGILIATCRRTAAGGTLAARWTSSWRFCARRPRPAARRSTWTSKRPRR